MRQVKLLALMTALTLTLCSCTGGQTLEEKASEIQSEYSAWENLSITADITADYGDRVYEFKVKYTGNDTEGTVEVLEPELIAGLRAKVSEEGSALVYDGAELSLGDLTASGISPMESIPLMISQWSKGYIQNVVTDTLEDKDTFAITFTLSEKEYLITWFEADTNLPVKTEVYFDNSMVLSCEFENIVT